METTTHSLTEPPIPLDAIRELEERLGVSLAGWQDCAPRFVSPSLASVPGARFDVDEVVRIVEVLRLMPHTKGRWARVRFEPSVWQLVWIIAPVFGWKNVDGFRIVREVWDEVPRKNGKSTLSSRLALVLLTADGEDGPEVYAAATSTEQARQVFNEAKVVAERSPDIRRRTGVPLASVIRVQKTFGVFRVLSKVAESVHGLNVSGAVVDEVHLHKKRDLIDAIETGTGARVQPLIFYITTAGDDDETTIYAEKHNYALALAEGAAHDPSVWVCVWCADKSDDPFSPVTWRKANPNYPESPRHEYLEQKAEKARVTPTFLPSFLRLHLNLRTAFSGERWNGADHWSEVGNVGLVDEQKLAGKRAFGGLAAWSASDMTALCWTFDNPEGDGVWSLWRFFLPEDQLSELNRRTHGAAEVWSKTGLLTLTEGNQLDTEAHVAQIRADCARFDVRQLAYEGALGIIAPLMQVLDADAFRAMSPTTAGSSLIDFERLLSAGEYNHGGNPIAAWQVAHLIVRETAAAVLKIDRKASPENVYGLVAAEYALRSYLTAGPEKKVGRLVSF